MQVTNILALDVGERRIGVALANTLAKLPSPLTTIANNQETWQNLRSLIDEHGVTHLVVGLPRNLSGDDTAQTAYCREFAETLKEKFSLDVTLQDEALTSHKAEEELKSRKTGFDKAAVDALAATYILDDYLGEHYSGVSI